MKDQPFIIPLSGLVSGILLGQLLPEGIWYLRALIIVALLLFIFSVESKHSRVSSLVVLLFFVFLGSMRTYQFNNSPDSGKKFTAKKEWVKLKIENPHRSSEKFRKYKAAILSRDSVSQVKTFALLYWDKENPPLNADDELWVYTKIRETESPKNPYQFDYKKYLSRQQIRYVLYTDSVYLIEKQGRNMYHHFTKFKSETRKELLDSGFSENATDIMGAMLLGDRTEMNEEIEENYRKTGVVHILSISGLHVVMVYTIFFYLLYPLTYLPKGKTGRIILSLLFIWAYAMFVEMQPPVARSALMITIFHFATVLRRKPNIYHTLAVSAFVLLLVNPNFLFDVGFQLSYAAVFFIVWLMPVYRRLLPFRNRILGYSRDFIGTSISAQAGTFPIAAFYFHQSSGLFLAGNVLMIPASFIMIAGGMLSVLFASLNIELPFWTKTFNCFFHWCNEYIGWLSSHENWVFENLSFDLAEVIILILSLLILRYLVLNFTFKILIFMLSLLLVFELNRIYKACHFNQKEEVIVFHQFKNSVIGVRNGSNLDVYISDQSNSDKLDQYVINPYVINEGIRSVNEFDMEDESASGYVKTKNLIFWKGKRILIVNENMNSVRNDFDYILIQNSSKINLDSISKSTEIILDGSNYPDHLKHSLPPIWRTADLGFKRIIP